MGWEIGYDEKWNRDIGYGVPAICDHPLCNNEIHRGLGYVCGQEPYGGDKGCGLFFCYEHLYPDICDNCLDNKPPFIPKSDTEEWITWKLKDDSWEEWRKLNPKKVEYYKSFLKFLKEQ